MKKPMKKPMKKRVGGMGTKSYAKAGKMMGTKSYAKAGKMMATKSYAKAGKMMGTKSYAKAGKMMGTKSYAKAGKMMRTKSYAKAGKMIKAKDSAFIARRKALSGAKADNGGFSTKLIKRDNTAMTKKALRSGLKTKYEKQVSDYKDLVKGFNELAGKLPVATSRKALVKKGIQKIIKSVIGNKN